jgi:hypothetical protein
MNKKKREKNETEFESWIEKEDGNRIYSFEIFGGMGWKAKYLKEVDREEVTLNFGRKCMMKIIF